MKRIKKKDITAAVLSLCVMIVADPFLQSGLIGSEKLGSTQETIDLGVITPDNIADLLSRLPGSNTEVFESGKEETAESVYPSNDNSSTEVVPAEEEENTATEEVVTEPEENQEDPEEEEQTVEPAEPTLEEKKAAILKELEENNKYTFDWYGKEITLTYSDYVYLCKLIQRETVGEDLEGRIMVVNVVFNRVLYPYFPDTVVSVINQSGQFDPVAHGTIKTAVPDSVSTDAVLCAMAGIDYSQGALYFKMTDCYSEWFNSLQTLFVHGCHTFYR